jgi:DNA modification methylase
MEKLKIEYVNIDSIKPYKNNAKLHPQEQIEQIKKSIEKFGMDDPIGIWKDEIVEGHGRLIACKELGFEEIPIIRLDHLTDEERKAYTLAHNKLTMNSDFDIDILNDELMNSFDTIDMSDFGFDLDFDVEEEQEIVEDEVPEVPEEPKAKLGDIYQLGNHRLMCGDSTKEEDVAKLMNGVKTDMVFTDPPYGINVVSDNGEVGANFGVAKKGNYSKVIADETTDTAKASYNILKTLCNKLIIWGGNYFIDFLEPSDGWLIWDKRVDSGIKNTFADGEMAYCNFHTPIRIYHQLWNGMIREGEKDKRVHPTQKPIKMLSEILQDFSKENETIIDVFGGSGSTLIACEQLNRKCYMMELDPHYIDVIIQRWENFTGKKAIKLN